MLIEHQTNKICTGTCNIYINNNNYDIDEIIQGTDRRHAAHHEMLSVRTMCDTTVNL